MNKAALIFFATATLLSTSGCGNRMWEDGKQLSKDSYNYVFDSAPTTVPYHDVAEIPMIEINHDAADVLNWNVGDEELAEYSAIHVNRFTNQVDPNDTSVFGQVVADQVSDRLVQKDLHITEGEPAGTDYIYAGSASTDDYRGLTDKKRDELPPRVARLTGTYVIGDNFIYLSARITRLVDHTVVSAHNWTIPISDNVRAMLPQLQKPSEGMTPTVATSFQ